LEQTGEEEGAKVASFNQSEKEVEVLDLSLRGEREREREREEQTAKRVIARSRADVTRAGPPSVIPYRTGNNIILESLGVICTLLNNIYIISELKNLKNANFTCSLVQRLKVCLHY
jgi:hypothetical protein